jgi:hypothetical protein
VFDEDAGVFDYEEASGAGFGGGVLAFDSQLHPDYFCADGDGAVDDGRDVFGAAKDVDDFDVAGFRYVFEAWVGFFAEDFGFVGIYGDDAVAGGLQVLRDAKTGTSGIGREADYRDGFIFLQDVGDYVITARPVIGNGCSHGDACFIHACRNYLGVLLGFGRKGLWGFFPLRESVGRPGLEGRCGPTP